MDRPGDILVRKLVDMHPGWGLAVEAPPGGPRSGFLQQVGGSGRIRYVFGEDERGAFLEFYSFHRVWGDVHARIREDGTVEGLDEAGLLSGEPIPGSLETDDESA